MGVALQVSSARRLAINIIAQAKGFGRDCYDDGDGIATSGVLRCPVGQDGGKWCTKLKF